MLVNIREPFWSAWKFYGWEKGVPGIGIAEDIVMKALREKGEIFVRIKKDYNTYIIGHQTIIEMLKKYRSVRSVGNGKKVAVFPKTAFITKQTTLDAVTFGGTP